MLDYDVIIVGGGFGGAYAARSLERKVGGARVRTLLIAEENFLLFAPVLPEAASGTLEPRHAVIPLREMLRGTEIVSGHVDHVDTAGRSLTMTDLTGRQTELAYRYLVLSPGSVPATIDVPGLREEAVGFKTIADATWLRNQVLHQLEAAESSHDPRERRRLLTFTFVGGGYAGVEGLAELESLACDATASYRRVEPADLRWVLVEAADTLLPGLKGRLARYTEKQLRARGVEVRLKTRLTSCIEGRVVLDDPSVEPYESETIVWTTGQRPSDLVAKAGLPLDERGRVIVDDHLRVKDRPGVYALGDTAAVPDRGGGLCPPTAQHAMRQGLRAGKNVAAELGVGKLAPFRYRNRGLAVTLGNRKGTAQVFRLTVTGWLAWWMGRSYHLLMMPGWARRARVVSDWTIGLLFPRDTAQLGELGDPPPLPPPP